MTDLQEQLAKLTIQGRTATQDDVDAGRCVFFIPGDQSEALPLNDPLPVRATVIADIGSDSKWNLDFHRSS